MVAAEQLLLERAVTPPPTPPADLSAHSRSVFSLGLIESLGSAPECSNCFLIGLNSIRRKIYESIEIKSLFGSWAALVLVGPWPAGHINPTMHLGGGIGQN